MGTGVVPAKEKAKLLKIIFSKKNAFSELLATEKPKHTKYTLSKVFCRHRTQLIPNQTKFDYLQERESN